MGVKALGRAYIWCYESGHDREVSLFGRSRHIYPLGVVECVEYRPRRVSLLGCHCEEALNRKLSRGAREVTARKVGLRTQKIQVWLNEDPGVSSALGNPGECYQEVLG